MQRLRLVKSPEAVKEMSIHSALQRPGDYLVFRAAHKIESLRQFEAWHLNSPATCVGTC